MRLRSLQAQIESSETLSGYSHYQGYCNISDFLLAIQGIQATIGQGEADSFSAAVWYGPQQIGNISVAPAVANLTADVASAQIFAIGGSLSGGQASISTEAGRLALFIIKTADSSGVTLTQGISHPCAVVDFCFVCCAWAW